MSLSLKAAAFLLALAGTSFMSGAETRIWTNNTDRPWTIHLEKRDQVEIGNMNFIEITGKDLPEPPTLERARALGLQEVPMGEASLKPGGISILTLPKYSRWLVEFTSTNRRFYHAFSVRDIFGQDAGSFACDDPLYKIGGKFKLESIGKENPKPFLLLNGTLGGELTIIPATYTIVNGAKCFLRVRAVKRDGFPAAGRIMARNLGPSSKGDYFVPESDFTGRGGLLAPQEGEYLIAPGRAMDLWAADGKVPSRAALEVSPCSETEDEQGKKAMADLGGGWVLTVALDSTKPYPGNAEFKCPEATMLKRVTDSPLKDFATKGRLKLEIR